ncbi:MAG: hypothetical protein C0476_01850 [Sphingomonas sp.]|nr:hypothetical protein [Sphingomonas sp.]
MSARRTPLALATGLGALALIASDGPTGRLRVLAQIKPGEWELQEQGSQAAPKRLCMTDADILVQYQHNEMRCTRFVVEDQPMSATVTYDCRSSGRGRTAIRASTSRAIHVETQGIAFGAPFETSFNARRIGACRVGLR